MLMYCFMHPSTNSTKGPSLSRVSLLTMLEMHMPFSGQLAGERLSLNTCISCKEHFLVLITEQAHFYAPIMNYSNFKTIRRYMDKYGGLALGLVKKQKQKNMECCLRGSITTKLVLSFI